MEARCSLIIGPVEPFEKEIKQFMAEKLGMEPEAIEDLLVTQIRKVHVNKKKKKAKRGLTRLTFATVADRDLVISHASNLPDGFSVEMTAPDYLLSLRRYLEAFAFRIRKFARDLGLQTSTSVRFDDERESLLLAVREEGDEWEYYTKEDLQHRDDGLNPIDPPASNSGDMPSSNSEDLPSSNSSEDPTIVHNSTPRPDA